MAAARLWPILVILSLAIRLGWPSPTLAQETIECAEPVPAGDVATPESEASPVASEPVAFPDSGGELTVFAAASLTEVFERIATDLEAANDGLEITYNFAGSQALVTQLTEGAEADAFASASVAQMENAIAAGVIAGEPVVVAENRLAIVVPADNPAEIASLADLASGDLDLVLAAPEVPVGQYSREVACTAAADSATYGDGFLDGFTGNIVSNEDNARAVLAKVQLGEADAGIVYTTDVTPDIEDEVQVIEIPDQVNAVAAYPIAPVADGDPALAAAFVSYLIGPAGQATLAEFRFQPAR